MGPLAGALLGAGIDFVGNQIGNSIRGAADSHRANTILNHDYTKGEPAFSGFISNAADSLGDMFSSAGQWYQADKVNRDNVRNTESGQAYNAAEAQKSREFNAEQAKLNREFQERMSGSSYQRAVGDLRKAGINPMLAFSQGGASTPGGSAASGGAASSGAYQGAVNPLAGSLSTAYQSSQIRNIEADTANKYTTNPLIEAQTAQQTASAANLSENTNVARMQVSLVATQINKVLEETFLAHQQGLTQAAQRTLWIAQRDLYHAQEGLAKNTMGLNDARAALAKVQKQLLDLEVPRMENQAAFEASAFGDAAPYVRGIFNMISDLLGIGRGIGRVTRP